jgi:hypothetical protein
MSTDNLTTVIVNNGTSWSEILQAILIFLLVSITIFYAVQTYRQANFLKKQIDEDKKSRQASVLLKIYDIMNDLRPKWHELYTFPDNFHDWSVKQKALADFVGAKLQNVAYLCLSGLIDKEYVKLNWMGTFYRCWNKLEQYIKDYRIQSGEHPEISDGASQRIEFEIFAKECEVSYKKFLRS